MMARRNVNDARGNKFRKDVSKGVRNMSDKILPRGWTFVDRDGQLFIKNLATNEERPV